VLRPEWCQQWCQKASIRDWSLSLYRYSFPAICWLFLGRASGFARFFCPLSEGSFYRKALQAGYRTIKVMNYMALGPYEHPDEVWMPSVLY
jgi:hypothetical protein